MMRQTREQNEAYLAALRNEHAGYLERAERERAGGDDEKAAKYEQRAAGVVAEAERVQEILDPQARGRTDRPGVERRPRGAGAQTR